jgi:hypothetical protein
LTRYAEGTTVSAPKTRAEIESYLAKQGATRFAFGYVEDRAGISFVANGRMVRFTVPNPDPAEKGIIARARRLSRSRWRTDPPALLRATEEEERRRWRCLLLAIKAKWTTVESGIESFDEAFLANIVTDDNITVWERIKLEGSGVKLLSPREGSG